MKIGPGQGGVGPAFHRFHGRGDSAFAAVHRDRFKRFHVFQVVSQTEMPQTAFVVRNALHQDVVVFRGGKIAPAGLGFANDGFREVVKGTRNRPQARRV
jgi:hypothetical protein